MACCASVGAQEKGSSSGKVLGKAVNIVELEGA